MSEVTTEVVRHLIKYRKEAKGSILMVWLMLMIPTIIDSPYSIFVWGNAAIFFLYDSVSLYFKRLPDVDFENNSAKIKKTYLYLTIIFSLHWGLITAYIFSNSQYEPIYIATALVLAFSTVGGFSVWLLSASAGKFYLFVLYMPSIAVLLHTQEIGAAITAVFMVFCVVVLIQQGKVREKYVLDAINYQLYLDKQANRYKEISDTDPLTGVFNRRYFDLALESQLKNIDDTSCLSLLVIDIDHFKSINDEYGHDVGDDCLCEAVKIIQQEIRLDKDILCRFGGEEFVVLLIDADKDKSTSVASRICHRFRKSSCQINHLNITMTVSIGISTSENATGPDALFKTADKAMYHAKNIGRDKAIHIADI